MHERLPTSTEPEVSPHALAALASLPRALRLEYATAAGTALSKRCVQPAPAPLRTARIRRAAENLQTTLGESSNQPSTKLIPVPQVPELARARTKRETALLLILLVCIQTLGIYSRGGG